MSTTQQRLARSLARKRRTRNENHNWCPGCGLKYQRKMQGLLVELERKGGLCKSKMAIEHVINSDKTCKLEFGDVWKMQSTNRKCESIRRNNSWQAPSLPSMVSSCTAHHRLRRNPQLFLVFWLRASYTLSKALLCFLEPHWSEVWGGESNREIV